jgi:protein-disulfide isomerase
VYYGVPQPLFSADCRGMARKGKSKRAPQPPPKRRPSGLAVVLAFAVAIGVAVALVVAAVVLRTDDEESAPATPTPVVQLDGIPQDGTVLGSTEAGVTIIEYADLQCPACRAFGESVWPTVIDQYVRPGDVKAELRGISFIGPDSEKAVRLVYAAGLQDRLWHLQEALYRNQGAENSGWVTDELVRDLAGEIPGLDVERLFDDAEGPEVEALMRQAASQAEQDEISGTPSVFVQQGDGPPVRVERPGVTDVAVALDQALGR